MEALWAVVMLSMGSMASTQCGPNPLPSDEHTEARAFPAAPNEYIVRFSSTLSVEDLQSLRNLGLDEAHLKSLGDKRTYLIVRADDFLTSRTRVDRADDKECAPLHPAQCNSLPQAALPLCALLACAKPATDYVEPNYLWSTAAKEKWPNDRNRPDQWALDKIEANLAADRTLGASSSGRRIIVAVIDTGVDMEHEDMKGQLWSNSGEEQGYPDGKDGSDGNGVIDDLHGANFAGSLIYPCSQHSGAAEGYPCDNLSHGTSVASIIAAVTHNHIGVASIAPEARIMAVKFLSTETYDDLTCKPGPCGSSWDAVKAINYAVKMRADIINLSWGGKADSVHLCGAILAAKDAGVLVVAAAGNQSNNTDDALNRYFPANFEFDNIISVQSSSKNDKPADYTNWGPKSVDIAAPGDEINVARIANHNDYQNQTGTSMAAAHVSGALALVKSLALTWDYEKLITYLLDSADHPQTLVNQSRYNGRLNLRQATAAPADIKQPTSGTSWRAGQSQTIKWKPRFESRACPTADFDLILADDASHPVSLKQDIPWQPGSIPILVPNTLPGKARVMGRCAGTQIAAWSEEFTVR